MTPEQLVDEGNALYRQGDVPGAMARYREALAADGGNARAHYNTGVLLHELGRLEEARAAYAAALERNPGHAQARVNLGVLSLFAHDFARGWDAYELRLDTGGVKPRGAGLPRLRLEDLRAGSKVAVWSEQGLGDQVLFATLLPELVARGAVAVMEADARLIAPFRRSLAEVQFVAKAEAPTAFAACDSECPLASLGGLFRRSVESFRRQPRRLLLPDPVRRDAVHRELGAGRRIGFSWRTFQPPGRSHLEKARSVPLEAFGVFDGLGATLVDLQYGDVGAERAAFDARHPGLRREVAGLDAFRDSEGLLAAIDACDLVVTPSNVTAHLAGALGKRTWLVYRGAVAPFHYWTPGPDQRSLWYPSVEIVTDPAWTSWEKVLAAVADRWQRES